MDPPNDRVRHGAAIQSVRRDLPKPIRNPGGYFAKLVKNRWWEKPPGEQGGMPDSIDFEAQKVIRELDRPHGHSRPHFAPDPDAEVARERAKQFAAVAASPGLRLKIEFAAQANAAGLADPGASDAHRSGRNFDPGSVAGPSPPANGPSRQADP